MADEILESERRQLIKQLGTDRAELYLELRSDEIDHEVRALLEMPSREEEEAAEAEAEEAATATAKDYQ